MCTKPFVESVFMKKWISTVLLLGVFLSIKAQGIPVGSWRNHISFSGVSQVISSENMIFSANDVGLFLVADEVITLISKIDGLSQPGATALAFDVNSGKLIVGHSTGEIDVVSNNGVSNITTLLAITQFANKSINSIQTLAGRAYFGTDFGIGILDLEINEIVEFYSEIGANGEVLNISELIIAEDRILASTDEGLIIGNLNTNLLDFNNWTSLSSLSGFQLALVDNKVYASRANNLFEISAENALNTVSVSENTILDLTSDSSNLYALTDSSIETLDDGSLNTILSQNFSTASQITTHNDEFLVADEFRGLLRLSENSTMEISPNGPTSNDIASVKFLDKVYATYQELNTSITNSLGYSDFDGVWNNTDLGVPGVTDVEQFQGQIVFSTTNDGIIDFNGSAIDIPDQNTSLSISAMTSNSNYLYAVSGGSGNDIYRFDGESWQSFEQIGGTSAYDISLSFGGLVWIRDDPTNGGIYALDPELNSSFAFRSTSDGLPSPSVRSLAIDLNDQVWIGTTEGPAFISNASFVDNQTEAFQPFFDGRPFLEGESITALAIDGGNRKWFGTENGIWVLSENDELIDQRFTTDNSPLLSDNIKEFAYDFESGEMFILTDIGLCSYQTASSQADFFQSNITIFPNPVRPNSQDQVTIKGLDFNVNLKVTKINGELVYETFAVGGTATWNLQTISNEIVQGGVYLLFTSSFDGEQTFVGKVAVIR